MKTCFTDELLQLRKSHIAVADSLIEVSLMQSVDIQLRAKLKFGLVFVFGQILDYLVFASAE
jgi:hypothetical protein